MRHYYAVAYHRGSSVLSHPREDRVYRFDTPAQRSEWVNAGAAYIGPGEREAITYRHARRYEYYYTLQPYAVAGRIVGELLLCHEWDAQPAVVIGTIEHTPEEPRA